ncbi:MAG: penicillin-binding transpeptidase domain-containing protein [Acidobacteriota bacterium]|nr:penicillin-binding transpeptidase domain-containing protein [Acidobacteriota bacterium]
MYPLSPKFLPKICFAAFAVFLLCAVNLTAQTRKSPVDRNSRKAADVKKTGAKTSDTNQTSAAKSSKKLSPKEERAERDKQKIAADKAGKIDKNKSDKNPKAKQADLNKSDKNKPDNKKAAAVRAEENRRRAAEEAERRAAAEERRRQILAEQQQRAQLAREAQARHIAFERGLRTETVENIARDNTDGEDLEVRAAAVNALGSHAGTILVMEAQTGKVVSIVNQDWAIRHSFKPCSTIKLVTAVAGINEKVIGDDGKINARRFPMGLDDALAFSNNSYFQTVGAGLGNAKMIAYAQMLGLGQPTGINAAGESGGRLAFGNNNARIYSHGDDFEVTPLQLGVVVSALSNGGRILVPHIPKNKIEKTDYRGTMRYQLKLPNDDFKNVLPGMIGAAQYGTARRGMDASLAVAGKTGSCTGGGSWLGLFASVAPVENPKYAVVVITRGQGERGKYAAAIAADLYKSLRSRLIERGTEKLARIPLDLKPQMKVNAQTSAKIDGAEGEDSEDNDASKTAASRVSAPKAIGKKGGANTDLFPSVVIKVRKSDELTRPRVVSNK